jgi:FtsP/CotA-like multicopper oxidase with cupredoxin domain
MMKKTLMISICLSVLVGVVAMGAAEAAEFHLRAEAFTIAMPDGEAVAMWGFALDTDGDFATAEGAATSPGPVLEVPEGDATLTIVLKNNLPAPVSLVIPGQIAVMSPVFAEDDQGRSRVRSFTHETAPGAEGTYTWDNFKPGTFLYQSGTHPAVQVQMGLYGAAFKDTAQFQAYSDAATVYNWQGVLVLSEIDPLLHAAVATDDYGPGKSITSTVDYAPRYFLYNGDPNPQVMNIGSPVAAVGNKILVRLLNAGLETRVPLLNGLYMKQLSEDGNLLPYPRQQYSLILTAGKTMDVMLEPASAGVVSFHDRRGYASPGSAGAGQVTLTEGAPIPAGPGGVGGGGGGGGGCFISTMLD